MKQSQVVSPIVLHSENESQTQQIAAQLARGLQPGDLVALEGELGAGKTVFVRGLAVGLGIKPTGVSSPTFVIRQEYGGAGPDAPALVHIDAYRLSGPDELETIGWNELLHDRAVIIAVEWPSRIAKSLPASRIEVAIEHAGRQSRTITISAPATLEDRLRSLGSEVKSSPKRTAKCRTCGTMVDASSQTFPFCSERCKLADLGKWFSEGYRVSRPAEADDELED